MKYQIRQSDDKSFYYLISIDSENNQTVIAENDNLDALKNHEAIPGALEVEVVTEEETRGIIDPLAEPVEEVADEG